MEPICPVCHVTVRSTDFFCYNCGKSLKEKPEPITTVTQVTYYLGSLLLPPLGYWWGYKFLKRDDSDAKRVGWICIIITTISLVVTIVWVRNVMTSVSQQVNQQMQGMDGF